MTDSLTLVTAQITFLRPRLKLIHIPIHLYAYFLQAILRLLFGEDHEEEAADVPWTNRHDFLNISITPVEVSIICTYELADKLVGPARADLTSLLDSPSAEISNDIRVAQEDFTVIQVDGQGIEAGARVLELTGPLAMAGISIFFITTYFSDYILVPSRAKSTVTLALEQRGFVFSKEADAFVSQLSPTLQQSQRLDYYDAQASTPYMWSPNEGRPSFASMPSTPPAKDIDELQLRTFRKLKSCNIAPFADPELRLVHCAGSRETDETTDLKLMNDLLQVLLAITPHSRRRTRTSHDDRPDTSTAFISITITATDPISILMEEHLLPRLGGSLLGAKSADDVLTPIIFDLRPLGVETTGIVGGVAGRLAQSHNRPSPDMVDVSPGSGVTTDGSERHSPVDIGFLSTARSGAVFVRARELTRALQALNKGYEGVDDRT